MSGFGLAQGLAQRSPRERFLVALLILLALPLALAFLVAQPMLEARSSAQQQQREVEALRGWVADQVRAMPEGAGPTAAAAAQSVEVLGLAGLENSLVTANLRDSVTQLTDRADGGVDLAFQDAPFDALAGWLSDASKDWGYAIEAFRFDAAAPGLVNAQFELAAP